MTERKEHFNEDLKVAPKFSADLEQLFKPEVSVPPEVDRAILDQAAQHFAGRDFAAGRRKPFRWVSLWKFAAAAAVVIFAFSLNLTHKPKPTVHRAVVAKADVVDFDSNGRVDILDAFKLARRIELAGATGADLDINGDGLVDRGDVDTVALAAVSLQKGVL